MRLSIVLHNPTRSKIALCFWPYGDNPLLWMPQGGINDEGAADLQKHISQITEFVNFEVERCVYVSPLPCVFGFAVKLQNYDRKKTSLLKEKWMEPREALTLSNLSPLSRKVLAAELLGHTISYYKIEDSQNESCGASIDPNTSHIR